MSLTIELPDELAAALTDDAARAGMSLPDYATHLLTAARPIAPPARSPAELVAYWCAEGLIGDRPDIPENVPEYARQLREQAERRGR